MSIELLRDSYDGQIRLDFDGTPQTVWNDADLQDETTFKEKMKVITDEIGKLAIEREKQLIEQGLRIFNVKEINDTTSIEADYGAPAIGLHFMHSLVQPERSYRYEPTENIEGVTQTHVNQSRLIGRSLKAQGYKIFNGQRNETYPSQIHFSNGGVTRAFDNILGNIVSEFEVTQNIKTELGLKQSGAILVPVPTYGLFLYHLEQTLEDKDITIIPVRRHDNGAVDQTSLEMNIAQCRENNIRIIGYYDCNPQNPTGYIREREETEKIAKILMKERARQTRADINALNDLDREEIKNCPETNKKVVRLLTSLLDKPQGNLIIIDDMAYEGLELTGKKKPYSFGQVSTEVAQQTAILKGISKIGMPGIRIGLTIAHPELIENLTEKQLFTEFTANSLGVDILAARFGSTHKKEFRNHLKRLRRIHAQKAAYIQAFFRGLDNAEDLSEFQKSQLIKKYARTANIPVTTAKERLHSGLPNFRVPDGPECGFFQRVYCDALQGRLITVKFQQNTHGPVPYRIYDSNDLYWVFKSFNIKTIPASWQGMPDNSLMVRISTSVSDENLFKFFDNMREMHEYFWGDKPQVQLDLFRDKYPTLTPKIR